MATLLLSTEALITTKPEQAKKPGRGGGEMDEMGEMGGMGGMGGMDF